MSRRPTIKLAHGGTREVLLFGRWVLKVPTLRYGTRQAVLGMLANLNERDMTIHAAGDRRLARTVWCAPFGMAAVQERVGKPLGRSLSHEERYAFPLRDFCGEPSVEGHNTALRQDGTLVCFDYGGAGMYSP